MEISIIWSTEDVLYQAKHRGIKITENEANKILLNMESNHLQECGINWETIDYYLDDLVDERDYSY